MAQYLAPQKITPRRLASDDLPATPKAPAKPARPPETRLQRKRRLRWYRDLTIGVVIVGALVFLALPKEVVNRNDEIPLPPETPETAPPPPPATVAATPEAWVANVRIGGALPSRIVLDGKPYARDIPIGPFNLKWIGLEQNTLIFQGPDGAKYRREIGAGR